MTTMLVLQRFDMFHYFWITTQEGMQEALQKAILRLLSRKFGQIAPELKSQVETLAIPQLENLTEAVLDFTSTDDLETWLRDNA